jgi:uncharacterized protein (DUF433 family)
MTKTIIELIGGEPYEYIPMGVYIVKAKGVCGGRPTFKYTRILVAGTLDRVRAGECVDTIVTSYRNRVSKDAILEAIAIAEKVLE